MSTHPTKSAERATTPKRVQCDSPGSSEATTLGSVDTAQPPSGRECPAAFQAEQWEWVRKTFPTETPRGVFKHLKEEIKELGDDLSDPKELADCFLLLQCLASHHGVDLYAAARAKFEECKSRTWQEIPGVGFRHVKPERPKPAAPTPRATAFAQWFRSQLPANVKPGDGWETTWAKCYDDMVRLDKRTPEEIAAVCKAARADAFWTQQFLSPLKLRKRDDAGVMYFDKFAQLTTAKLNRGRAAVATGRHYEEPTRELPEG